MPVRGAQEIVRKQPNFLRDRTTTDIRRTV
jgi:hypothetical protein